MTEALFDEAVELAAISCCMDIPEFIDTGPATEHFATRAARSIHSALVEMRRTAVEVNDLSLLRCMESRGMGRGEVIDLLTRSRSVQQRGTRAIAAHMRQLYERRTIAELASQGRAHAVAGDLEAARDTLARAAFTDTGELRVYSIKQAMESAVEAWSAAAQALTKAGQSKYVPIGICPAIDSCVLVGPGDTVVIGAETSVGKSSTSMSCLLRHQAQGIRAGLISVEDPREDWGAKAAGYYAQIDTQPLWSGNAPALIDKLRVTLPSAFAQQQHVHIVDVPSGRLHDVVRGMTTLVRVHGARILFVDYLQAVAPPSAMDGASAKAQTDYVYRHLQATARMLGVPLVITSQLSRGDSEYGEEPSIKRLKESGNIENGAQIVLLLWCIDEENLVVKGKAAKLKRVRKKPRWAMRRGNGGVLTEIDNWHEEPPSERLAKGRGR